MYTCTPGRRVALRPSKTKHLEAEFIPNLSLLYGRSLNSIPVYQNWEKGHKLKVQFSVQVNLKTRWCLVFVFVKVQKYKRTRSLQDEIEYKPLFVFMSLILQNVPGFWLWWIKRIKIIMMLTKSLLLWRVRMDFLSHSLEWKRERELIVCFLSLLSSIDPHFLFSLHQYLFFFFTNGCPNVHDTCADWFECWVWGAPPLFETFGRTVHWHCIYFVLALGKGSKTRVTELVRWGEGGYPPICFSLK